MHVLSRVGLGLYPEEVVGESRQTMKADYLESMLLR